jgi:cytochrome bd-type quinol oxidase subunit 2
VLAGAVLAAAISLVLLTFGAAIGLSATSPWPNSGVSAKVIASVAVFWAMAQQIGAFMAGGYIAGRMRSRWHETGHEVEFRDGLHGGLVWAVGVVIGARKKRDGLPFALTVLFFLAAFLSLGVMFWPYMIPYSVTVANAAAPEASLRFLFYGGVVVLPVIAAYTIGVYWVFRGKVRKGYG